MKKYDVKPQKFQSRIEVCGGIASGKTTFSSLFKDIKVKAVLEDFQKNPFWEIFYSDPISYSFETELTFLLQHYNLIKVHEVPKQPFICDFSLILDLAYADITLTSSKKSTFLTVYREIIQELSVPKLVVYLRCEPKTQLKRIKMRGRMIEKSITIDYLTELNDALEERLKELKGRVPILSVDSENKNFASDKEVKNELINLVRQRLLS